MSDEAVELLDRLRKAHTSEEREAAARAVREYIGRPRDDTWNEARAKALSTDAWRNVIVDVVVASSTDGERRWVCEAICAITKCDNGARVFSTEGVREALVAMACAAGTDDARRWAASAVCSVTAYNADARRVFGTEGVRDALVAMARAAGTYDARRWIASAMSNITANNADGQRVLGTEGVREALAAMARAAGTDDERRWIASAMCNITSGDNADIDRVFSTDGVRNALVAMAHAAGTDDAREWIAEAISNITANNADGRRVFGTADVRDALVTMARAASTDEVRWSIAMAMNNITANNADAVRAYGTADTVRAALEMLNSRTRSAVVTENVGALQARLAGAVDATNDPPDDDDKCEEWLRAADRAHQAICPGVEGRVSAFFTCAVHKNTHLRAVLHALEARRPGAAWYVCDGNDGRCRVALCSECHQSVVRARQWRCTCGARAPPGPAPASILRMLLAIAPKCPRGCGARVPLRDAPTHVCDHSAPKRVKSDPSE